MGSDLILDPFSGLAGDMWLGLLVDLGLDPGRLEASLAGLSVPTFEFAVDRVLRGALTATRLEVRTPAVGQGHRGLAEVEELLDAAGLPARVASQARQVFSALATIEGRIHGVPPERVHFHEVGALDCIVDICGVLLGLQELGIQRVWTLPVALGSGTVACAHGCLPLPSPAAAALLVGFPVRSGPGPGEFTTPTGAALLQAVARPLPPEATFVPERVGYGAGAREVGPLPNVLRGWLASVCTEEGEPLWQLEVQLDDLTGEAAGYLLERLFATGAIEAWIVQVLMKKGRPGLLVCALADEGNRPALEAVLLSETQSLGLRRHRVARTRLPRAVRSLETSLGPVLCKVRTLPGGRQEWSVEQEEAARLAGSLGLPLGVVLGRLARELPSD